MSVEFLVTTLIVVATPGTGVLYTLAAGLSRGVRASVIAAVGCTLGIVPHMIAAITGLAALLHTSAVAFQTGPPAARMELPCRRMIGRVLRTCPKHYILLECMVEVPMYSMSAWTLCKRRSPATDSYRCRRSCATGGAPARCWSSTGVTTPSCARCQPIPSPCCAALTPGQGPALRTREPPSVR